MSGQNNEKRGLVPKLRFPEFRDAGEWEEKPLAKVCNVLQGYGFPEVLQGKSKGKYPFCKVSDISRAVAENGGLLAEATNYVGDDELLKLRAKLIPKGATVFAKIGEALRLNRRVYVQKECLIDNNVTGLKAIDKVADDYFVYLLSQLIDLNKHCGGAVPSVNKSTLEEIEVVVPGPDEQKRIADCLSSIDDLITAQAQKLNTLKDHKKGLMQQLFPAEGETMPKLRFPEFRDAGEWEECELGLMTTKVGSGITPTGGDKNYKAEGHPFVRSQNVGWGELILGDVVFIDEETHQSFNSTEIKVSDVLLNITGASIGRSAVADSRIAGGNVNQHVCIIRVKQDELNPALLNHFLISERGQKQIDSFQAGGNRQGLNFAQIRSFQIPLPPTVSEQGKIADCLASLDELIAAQSKKLDTLKNHKKGLMQQLFPSMEAEV